MTDLLREGLAHFNSGRYYDAHESWEDLWRETGGEGRSFYQGLVQVAVGLHHISQGNPKGGRRVLRRGLERLEAFPDGYAGLDNARLQQDIQPLLEGGEPGILSIRLTGKS